MQMYDEDSLQCEYTPSGMECLAISACDLLAYIYNTMFDWNTLTYSLSSNCITDYAKNYWGISVNCDCGPKYGHNLQILK